MTQDRTVRDEMHYDVLAQDALRGVVKAALKRAASPEGLPGDHHFYITFKTKAAGVSGPADLLGKYPDEMTIVLQHRYKDLAPGETFFAVTLSFDGIPRRLSIPYAAVTRFYDPSVQFLLQFEPPADRGERRRPCRAWSPSSTPPTALPRTTTRPTSDDDGEDEAPRSSPSTSSGRSEAGPFRACASPARSPARPSCSPPLRRPPKAPSAPRPTRLATGPPWSSPATGAPAPAAPPRPSTTAGATSPGP